jgi:hypothetical protein
MATYDGVDFSGKVRHRNAAENAELVGELAHVVTLGGNDG